jgi:hypothetical protein
VVHTLEPHHLKGECFLAEVGRRAKPDWQVDLSEGLARLPGATPWNGVVLGRSWSNPIPSRCKVCA